MRGGAGLDLDVAEIVEKQVLGFQVCSRAGSLFARTCIDNKGFESAVMQERDVIRWPRALKT